MKKKRRIGIMIGCLEVFLREIASGKNLYIGV